MNWIRWLLCVGLLAAMASPEALFAQNGGGDKSPKDYRSLPLEGGAEALKKRLLDDELVEKILQEYRKNPEKMKELKALVEKSKSPDAKPAEGDQAKAKQQVEELLKNVGADPKKMDADQLNKVKQNLEKKLQENNKPEFHPPVDPNDPKAPKDFGGKIEPVPPKETPQPPKDDPLGKKLKGLFEDLDKGKFGKAGEIAKKNETIQQAKTQLGGGGKKSSASEAGKNAIANLDLKKSGGSEVAIPPANWLKKLSGGVDQPPHTPQGGAAGNLGNAGNPPTPPSLGLSESGLGHGALLFLQLLLILLVVAAIAIGVWHLLRRIRTREVQAALRRSIGPLLSGEVWSRAQLIQAFEQLALVVLGPGARSTNHRDIADNLGATPERTAAADELATLYERARYDPVEGELPATDLAAARRDLRLLAGMAAS